MTRRRGRCARGTRLKASAPFGKWCTQTFIAGLRIDGIIAPWVLSGAMNGDAFETYVRTQLVPSLRSGDIVILDNLNVHKSPRARAMIEKTGAKLMFLPRYSPDLNPIEMAFSKLKERLRAGAHRSLDALWRAIGDICDLYSPQECQNYLRAAGYAHT